MFEQWLKKMTLTISALHYRVTARGVENFPADGGVLLLPNHVSYVDAIILSLASPRPVRFLSEEDFFHRPLLGRILRLFNGIPVSPRRAKDGIVKAAEALTAGEVVCIFPEGRLTRDGELSDLQAGFQLIARRAANSQIVVARIDGLWGSIFSYYGGRLFTKLPRRLVRRVTVSFSVPLTASEATSPLVAKEMRLLRDSMPSNPAIKRCAVNCSFLILHLSMLALAAHLFFTIRYLGLLSAVSVLLVVALMVALGMIRRCILRRMTAC